MIVCERCGTSSPDGFRYCGACGSPLIPEPTSGETRKIVTALFCDIADSTALGEQLDPELVSRIINRYFEVIRETVRHHGGTVQKFAGDAILAVFGVPQVHEDDALRAVRAAWEIRERTPGLAAEAGVALRFRTGINTGLVITDVGRSLAIGDAVNVAARLQSAAQPDEILIGAETLTLVLDAVETEQLEPLRLKGKSERVPAYRLRAVDPTAPGRARSADASFVGRERELRLLHDVWDRVVESAECHMVTILGPAGVGKSRLVDELIGQLGETATLMRGRCLPYGEGITFWPLVEALTDAGSDAQAVSEHLSGGGAGTAEELFLEIRQLLERLATVRPVVLHIDDLQWAEPMLVDVLESIRDLSAGASLLALCTARPELFEEYPNWGGGKLNATALRLEPLRSEEAEQLLALIGGELSDEMRARVVGASEGNPLFLQEMAVLARERGAVEVPATIQALLAARLERLTVDERELLERAAIEGLVFHRSAVEALAEDRAPDVESGLALLVRKDLIRPHAPNVPGDVAFRFRHLLVRDAAYERISKVKRADLHKRYARWLEHSAVDFAEVDEIAGWHLEQAIQHDRELRRVVESRLSRAAAEHLYAAGRRAAERSDVVAARNLLERAMSTAPVADQLHGAVCVALAEQLIEVGDLARADTLLTSAERDHGTPGHASLIRLQWLVYAHPDEASATIAASLPALLKSLSDADDDRGLAKAHMLAFWREWVGSQATLAASSVRLAAEHARRAGDTGLWSRALGWYVATLIYGPAKAATITAELRAIEQQQPGPYLAAFMGLGHGEVSRLDGEFEDARRITREALAAFRALGAQIMAATCEQSLARIELSAGDNAAARDALLRSDAIVAEFGERSLRSTTQAMLARILERLGRLDEARRALELAESLSGPEERFNIAVTHEVRARLAAADSDPEAAERWAMSAVEHADGTDFVDLRAHARLQLAEALRARGRIAGALAYARVALDLYDAKGDRPGRESAAAQLAACGDASS